MTTGIIYSLIAGLFIAIQGVFNARVSTNVGLWETTVLVHFVGLVVGVTCMFIWGSGSFKKISEVNTLYLLGGAVGPIVVFSVIQGISTLGPTMSAGILLISQLLFATVIDTFGLFGTTPIKFHFTKPIGLLVMILGIVIFKLKG